MDVSTKLIIRGVWVRVADGAGERLDDDGDSRRLFVSALVNRLVEGAGVCFCFSFVVVLAFGFGGIQRVARDLIEVGGSKVNDRGS